MTVRIRRASLDPATQARLRIDRHAAIAQVIGAVIMMATIAFVVPAMTREPGDGPQQPPAEATVPGPAPAAAANAAALPVADTYATLTDPVLDDAAEVAPSGRTLRPLRPAVVYRSPGGPALAVLPHQQVSSDTWVPIISERPGWYRVLLPSRPNGATGWVAAAGSDIEVAVTPFRIEVDRAAFRMTLHHQDRPAGTWTVSVGEAVTATPRGRTFLLASLRDPAQPFSPVILPLGTHSETLTSYGGGPGTTAIHGWPTDKVMGTASSDGCIRVPPDALRRLSTEVPLGTPVLIR